jgi:hypothetical protein
MAQLSVEEVLEVRRKADEIAARTKSDPEFARRVVDSPRETLEAEGIPSEVVTDVLAPDLPGGVEELGCSVTCVSTENCFLTIKVCCRNTQPC